MNEARRLLRETNKTVVDVALDVGYTNPSHFAKLIRRESGLAPSDTVGSDNLHPRLTKQNPLDFGSVARVEL